jgi:hypothetical protein
MRMACRRDVRHPRLINLKHLPIKNCSALFAVFRIEADSLPTIARCVRNALISVAYVARVLLGVEKTNRRTQSTQAS